MVDRFTPGAAIELLNEGRIVHIEPQADAVIDVIAENMLKGFGRVREVIDDGSAMTALWSIRRGDQCVPFLHFEKISDSRLRKDFSLFGQYVIENPDFVLPVLLIGTRDIFSEELDGGKNDVLATQVAHLVAS